MKSLKTQCSVTHKWKNLSVFKIKGLAERFGSVTLLIRSFGPSVLRSRQTSGQKLLHWKWSVWPETSEGANQGWPVYWRELQQGTTLVNYIRVLSVFWFQCGPTRKCYINLFRLIKKQRRHEYQTKKTRIQYVQIYFYLFFLKNCKSTKLEQKSTVRCR